MHAAPRRAPRRSRRRRGGVPEGPGGVEQRRHGRLVEVPSSESAERHRGLVLGEDLCEDSLVAEDAEHLGVESARGTQPSASVEYRSSACPRAVSVTISAPADTVDDDRGHEGSWSAPKLLEYGGGPERVEPGLGTGEELVDEHAERSRRAVLVGVQQHDAWAVRQVAGAVGHVREPTDTDRRPITLIRRTPWMERHGRTPDGTEGRTPATAAAPLPPMRRWSGTSVREPRKDMSMSTAGSITRASNGTWAFIVDVPSTDGKRRQLRRRGFTDQEGRPG